MKILLIEDELKLAGFIADALRQSGHVCDHIPDGTKGLEAIMTGDYDLVLLDLMLPSMNGFDVLKNLKSFNKSVGVIILSALNDTENVIKGLDLGAVDYLKKPFDLEELLARVRSAQRRLLNQGTFKLKSEGLTVDLLSREVCRDGKAVLLSNREFALLEYLMTNSNKVLTKSQILEKVWDMNFDPGSNIVEVHLYQLRKKMDRGYAQELIQTVIGRGYIFKGNVVSA
ncbi:response regulator transcription factor [Mucilaginibacter pallidiroseus]|uniref:Response regulator transcription factor n=1 Tax=Mucilaginibacter pallidiroseus TaxID=2599295 RepID=A0A563UI32_9SPHI|nr:response regulator transcription factor [Mucilaginibacter pallidiroseus]TWR30939.1 response regulator transcription factor [Mucilaginibacter pallidiroseus]